MECWKEVLLSKSKVIHVSVSEFIWWLLITWTKLVLDLSVYEHCCHCCCCFDRDVKSSLLNISMALFLAPSTVIATSITPIGPAVAGYNFSMTCSVTLTNGFSGIPTISWTNPQGQALVSSGDLVLQSTVTLNQVSSSTVHIDPIRTSDAGSYTCSATFTSVALSLRANSSASYIVQVQQSKWEKT